MYALETDRPDMALIPPENVIIETLHWGLSLQYSTYYLTSRFTGGPPKDEPLNQLLPLVEFSFGTPRGQNTVATMIPAWLTWLWRGSWPLKLSCHSTGKLETAPASGRNYSSSSAI